MEKTVNVPCFVIEDIENTLRLVANYHNSYDKGSCFNRNVIQSLICSRKIIAGQEITGRERFEELKSLEQYKNMNRDTSKQNSVITEEFLIEYGFHKISNNHFCTNIYSKELNTIYGDITVSDCGTFFLCTIETLDGSIRKNIHSVIDLIRTINFMTEYGEYYCSTKPKEENEEN